MLWVGLTGGIGCGKSTVTELLKKSGIPVVDADKISHEVVAVGSAGLRSIVQEFGDDVVDDEGALKRKELANKVFSDSWAKHKLESIIHPLIQQRVEEERVELQKKGYTLAFYDVPLLFENRLEAQFDCIVVVTCSEVQQIERLKKRDGLSEVEIQNRIKSQMPLGTKEENADFVIHNDQNSLHLKREVERMLKWLREKEN